MMNLGIILLLFAFLLIAIGAGSLLLLAALLWLARRDKG